MLVILKKIWGQILETIFPRSKIIKDFLSMPNSEIWSIMTRSQTLPDKNLLAAFSYKQPLIRSAIWEIKYRGDKEVTQKLASLLYEFLLEELIEAEIFSNFRNAIIIPIPLSRQRLAERGFNQTERLAISLEEIDGKRNFTVQTDCLIKIKDTPQQSHTVSRQERLNNLKDCFAVKNPNRIYGQNIILLDDVITTGSTMKEARRVLKQVGVKRVLCMAIAH
jgi:ComF family protein